MIDLQALLDAIDQLAPDELAQVESRIEHRRTRLERGVKRGETPEERIALLHAALEEMRRGITAEEWAEIAEAMNAEYIEPEDPELFSWLDDLPADER